MFNRTGLVIFFLACSNRSYKFINKGNPEYALIINILLTSPEYM